ncbi:c-type cytochrome [Paracoccus tibetensis]|uniref:c-type cytochrome n=1 Tax=Paracoccus tibetensis TaxID=336292 RepID=UPI001FE09745|nr:cytochrome c [Paracoccus tibetensis]
MFLTALPALSLLNCPAASAAPSVERGEYLVTGPAACGNCHTATGRDGPDLSRLLGGGLVVDSPAFRAYAPNITPAARIGGWSDAELAKAIREGVRPDGTLIGPPMPFAVYRGLSDDDLLSIVAYLRTVPEVEGQQPESVYNIPLPPAYGPPVETVTHPVEGVSIEYGAYLAGPVSHCVECHSAPGPQGAMIETHPFAGGFQFEGPWGLAVATNLTPHPEDGLADHSDAELKAMITQGIRPNGERMMPPMPYDYFAKMTDQDVDAVILYLRSLQPLPSPE